MKPEDVTQSYADWLNDPRVNRFLYSSNAGNTIQTCLEYVRSYEGSADRALIGVFEKSTDLHLGNLTFSSVSWDRGSVTVGICMGREGYGGKGYATEAMISICQFCFDHLELHRIEAHVSIHNTRSVDLFLRSGFRVEGSRREADRIEGDHQDVYVMGLLSTDKMAPDARRPSTVDRGAK